MLLSNTKGASSRSSIVVWYYAWGHNKTIGAIAHRMCQLIWIILHTGVRYEERGAAVSEKSRRARTSRMIRTLRNLWLPSRTFGKSSMSKAIFDPARRSYRDLLLLRDKGD